MTSATQSRQWQARVALFMFGIAVLAGLPLTLLMDALGQPASVPAMVVHAVVASTCLAVLAVWGARVPEWGFHVLLIMGGLLVTLGCLADRADLHRELFYLWPALYSAYFFSRRQARRHVALIGAMYAAALVLGPPNPMAVTLWIDGMLVLLVLVEVVGRMRSRIDVLVGELTQMATTDGLTGLSNRRTFEGRLLEELARARRTGRPLALVLCDIDLFKLINDEQGHAAGDETLRRVAAALSDAAREHDVPARIGGEEFAVLLPEADAEGAMRCAERLREAVVAHTEVTISLGVASARDAGLDGESLLRDADRALYAAKAGGRNRAVAARPLLAAQH